MDRAEFIKNCQEINEFWGEKMPIMACKEAGELIQAISKCEQKKNEISEANLAAEIADMYISLMCLQYHYHLDTGEIDTAIERKLNRRYE